MRRDQLERAVGGMSGGSFQFPASSLVFCAVVYCCSVKEPDFERLSRLVLDEFKRVHDRLDTVDDRFDAMGGGLDRIETRLDQVDQRLSHIESELASINRRLDALDEQVASLKGFAKEIDELRGRVREIEKHLGINKKIAA